MKYAYARVLVLVAKWGAAGALLFALTLPFTTCQTSGGAQEHHVDLSWSNILTILCFAWPVPILVTRTVWPKMRVAYQIVIVECVLTVVAWVWLTLDLIIAAVMSLGGLKAGDGYVLASDALMGYLLLSGLDLAMLLRKQVSTPPSSSPVDAIPSKEL